MRTETVTIYTFDELSDAAKEKARDWYRAGAFDYDWWDSVYEDAKYCAALIGIDIENIYFSGFWSQGDGACFDGAYHYKPGGAKALLSHAPQDSVLAEIAQTLQDIQRRAFYQLSARVKQSGYYSHDGCTSIEVYRDGDDADADTHEAVAEALRCLMRWIYGQLNAQYDWMNADEQVDESILSNGYEFDEHGARV